MSGLDSSTGSWRPLVEYSLKKGVSLSTLRRYIKAGKIQYKVEQGRYLLFDADPEEGERGTSTDSYPVRPSARAGGSFQQSSSQASQASNDKDQRDLTIRSLEAELQKAREEIIELKTLIGLYEEKFPDRSFEF